MKVSSQARNSPVKQKSASPQRQRTRPQKQSNRRPVTSSNKAQARKPAFGLNDRFEQEARHIGAAFTESRSESLSKQNAEFTPLKVSRLTTNQQSHYASSSQLTGNIQALKSHGRPLETSLRSEMERFFGQSLSHIRINQGTQTDGVVRKVGAEAFASGPNLFFASPYTDFSKETNQELLAHELTHSLQQGPQAQGLAQFSTDQPLHEILKEKPLELQQKILDSHLKKHPSLKTTYTTWWDPLLVKVPNSAYPESEQDNAINDAMSLSLASGGKEGLSLLADFLRVHGLYKHVIQILLTEPELPTLHRASPLYAHVQSEKGFDALLKKGVQSGPHGKNFFPKIFIDALKNYGRWSYYQSDPKKRYAPRAGKDGQTVTQYIAELEKKFATYGTFQENELQFLPILIIQRDEDELLSSLEEIDENHYPKVPKNQVATSSAVSKHYLTLTAVKEIGETLRSTSTKPPLSWAGKVLGDTVVTGITPALRFWDKARTEEMERLQDVDDVNQAIRFQDSLGKSYHSDTSAAAVADTFALGLTKAFKNFLKVDRTDPKNQDQVFKQVPKQADTFIRYLDKSIRALMKVKSKANTGSAEELAAGSFAAAFDYMRSVVYQISPQALDQQATTHETDWVILKRRQTILQIQVIATQFSVELAPSNSTKNQATPTSKKSVWSELKQISEAANTGDYEVKFSQLALMNGFEKDPKATVEDFIKQAGKLSNLPFSRDYMRLFFENQKYQARIHHLNKKIDEQNSIPAAQKSVQQLGTVAAAYDSARKDPSIHHPQRYKSLGAIWIASNTPGISLDNRISRHPYYNELIGKLSEAETTIIQQSLSDGPNGYMEAVVWTIPSKNSLVSPLRKDPLLNGLVTLIRINDARFLTAPDPDKKIKISIQTGQADALFAEALIVGKDLKKNDDLVDFEFLNYLLQVDEVLKRIDLDQKAADLEAKARVKKSSSLNEIKKLRRTAESIDRKILGFQSTDGVLQTFYKYSPRTPKTWNPVYQSVLAIDNFYESVSDAPYVKTNKGQIVKTTSFKIRDIQIALLMLEIGEGIQHAYVNNEGWAREDIFRFVSIAARHAHEALDADPQLYLQDTSSLRTRIKILQDARIAMLKHQQDLQNQFGIQGTHGPKTRSIASDSSNKNTFRSLLGGATVYAGEAPADGSESKRGPFSIGASEILLKNIESNFTYFPPIGDYSKNAHPGPDAYGQPALLLRGHHNGRPSKIKKKDRFLNPKEVIVTVQITTNGHIQEHALKAEDLTGKFASLEWLSSIVHAKANLNSLENLKQIIETFAEGMELILSLTPAGWAILIKDILQIIVTLKNDPDFFKQLTEALSDPKAILDKVGALFTNMGSDYLFDILLNGDFDLSTFIGKADTHTAQKKPMKKGLGRTMQNLKRLGTVIGLRLQDFRNKAQIPVQGLNNRIATRPLLASLMNYLSQSSTLSMEVLLLSDRRLGPILNFIYANQGAIAQMAGGQAANNTGQFDLNDISAQMADIVDPINEVLFGITNFEFPEEVVPTEEIVQFLLEFAEHFASKKLKGKAKLIALAFTGIAHAGNLNEQISKIMLPMVQSANLDPNQHWKKQIVPKYKKPVEETIRDTGARLTNLIQTTPILKDFVAPSAVSIPSGDSIQVGTDSSHDSLFGSAEAAAHTKAATNAQNDLQASPALDRRASRERTDSSITRPTSGKPLSPKLRQSVEHGFGHNLGNVRIHQDLASKRLNQKHGAHALTAGSHILFNDTVNLNHQSGRSILNHEIGHVLQNTRGTSVVQAPKLNSSGSELNLSPSRESGAEKMRSLAANKGTGKVPIIGQGHPAYAPQLKDETFAKFIARLGDFRNLPDRQKAIDDDTVSQDTDKRALDIAAKIWDEFTQPILKSRKRLKFAKFLRHSDVEKDLLDYMTREFGGNNKFSKRKSTGPSKVVKVLAKKHQRFKQKPKNAPRNQKPVFTFAAKAFVKDLETYYYAKTGLLIRIKQFKYKSTGKDHSNAKVSSKGVGIEYLDLYLSDREAVEKQIKSPIQKTWEIVYEKTFGKKLKWTAINKRRKAIVRDILGNIWTPGSALQTFMMWDKDEPKLSDSLKQSVNEFFAITAIKNNDLPPWAAFIQSTESATKSKLTAPGKQKESIGMHLATHGHFKKGGGLKAIDRQSHHTTQYLLPEYFYNQQKSFKPFNSAVTYPGLSNDQKKFTNLTTNKTVEIEKTYRGSHRGNAMPAILLSGYSHLNSNLHLAPETEDGITGQGATIDLTYKKHINSKAPALGPDTDKNKLADYLKTLDANADKSEQMASEKIYSAMMSTYADMRTHMRKGLVKNMPLNTYSYYKKVASNEGSDDAAFEEKIKKPGAASATYTKTEMVGHLVKRAKEVYDNQPEGKVTLDGSETSIRKNLNDHVMEKLGWYWKK